MQAARVIVALSLVVGCKAERPDADKPDAAAMNMDMLQAPTIDTTTPTATPNGTVAIRGTTEGARVVISGGPGDPVVKSALPTGGYCIDAPLQASGPTTLTAYALKDGKISPPTTVTITKDAGAAIPPNAVCAGTEEPVCDVEDSSHANCTNNKDDDCDGYSDACDTGCNGCADDGFGPNWSPFFVPMVMPGTYTLAICPCRADWFAFYVTQGQVVHAKVSFNASAIDLDMTLQTPKNAEANNNMYVASSLLTSSPEEINWTANATGTYYLRIFSYKDDGAASYTLTVY